MILKQKSSYAQMRERERHYFPKINQNRTLFFRRSIVKRLFTNLYKKKKKKKKKPTDLQKDNHLQFYKQGYQGGQNRATKKAESMNHVQQM